MPACSLENPWGVAEFDHFGHPADGQIARVEVL